MLSSIRPASYAVCFPGMKFPEVVVLVSVDNVVCRFPVVMVSVTDADLQAYSRGHILRTAGPDYKILTVPALAPELYKHWYRGAISEFT